MRSVEELNHGILSRMHPTLHLKYTCISDISQRKKCIYWLDIPTMVKAIVFANVPAFLLKCFLLSLNFLFTVKSLFSDVF